MLFVDCVNVCGHTLCVCLAVCRTMNGWWFYFSLCHAASKRKNSVNSTFFHACRMPMNFLRCKILSSGWANNSRFSWFHYFQYLCFRWVCVCVRTRIYLQLFRVCTITWDAWGCQKYTFILAYLFIFSFCFVVFDSVSGCLPLSFPLSFGGFWWPMSLSHSLRCLLVCCFCWDGVRQTYVYITYTTLESYFLCCWTDLTAAHSLEIDQKFSRFCLCMCTDRNRLYTPNGNVHLIKFFHFFFVFFFACLLSLRHPQYFFFSLSHFRIGFIALHGSNGWNDGGTMDAHHFPRNLTKQHGKLLPYSTWDDFFKRKIYTPNRNGPALRRACSSKIRVYRSDKVNTDKNFRI